MRRFAPLNIAVLCVVALGVPVLAACSDDRSTSTATIGGESEAASTFPPCPGEPIEVVVTIGQWTDLVENLAGACGDVTTIVSGDAGDPHEFEPSPSDRAAFDHADLVVMNGADFDHWAEDALDSTSSSPAVVDAAEVMGTEDGDNPHLWYSPDAIDEVAAAVTVELTALEPDASDYFADRSDDWVTTLMPYTELVDRLSEEVVGRPYAATESVFDLMAEALGLVDVTPEGYRQAAANESEPPPGDLAAFEDVLNDGSAAVLVFNTQTEGALTAQLRAVSEDAGVPVVEVTETQSSDASFVDWQVSQLEALEVALGVHD